MSRSVFLPLLLLAALAVPIHVHPQEPPPAPRFHLRPLRTVAVQKTGMPAEKVDIVLVGDGYTRAQLGHDGAFEQHALAFREYLFSEPPFKQYRELCNFYTVYVESYDEGAENTPAENKLRNAFNSTYGVGGIERLLQYQDSAAVLEAARNAPAIDVVFVMVNDKRYGGSGGTIRDAFGRVIPAPCFSVGGLPSWQVAVHELGHSLANLGDEYVDATVADSYPLPFGARDFDAPNLTLARDVDANDPESLPRTLKWGHLLALPGAKGVIGLFEGAFFREKGVFRPSANCKMREYDQPFCAVCQEAIARRMHEICGRPFDDRLYHRTNPIRPPNEK